MMTSGTLGAALSTAIWSAIAGAAWAGTAARLLRHSRFARVRVGLANASGWLMIVMIPQGLRLWGPPSLVQRFLPHTLTVIELNLLVRIAAVCGLLGIFVAILYRKLDKAIYPGPQG